MAEMDYVYKVKKRVDKIDKYQSFMSCTLAILSMDVTQDVLNLAADKAERHIIEQHSGEES